MAHCMCVENNCKLKVKKQNKTLKQKKKKYDYSFKFIKSSCSGHYCIYYEHFGLFKNEVSFDPDSLPYLFP